MFENKMVYRELKKFKHIRNINRLENSQSKYWQAEED